MNEPRLLHFALTQYHAVAVTQHGFNLALHVQDNAADVHTRRQSLKSTLDLAHPIQWVHQVHGIKVHAVDDTNAAISNVADKVQADVIEADALTADDKTARQFALGILTADCLPIVIVSKDGKFAANIHAGWRGLQAGVIANTLQHTAKSSNAKLHAQDLVAWLGPCIGVATFEVGEEVLDAFLSSAENTNEAKLIRDAFTEKSSAQGETKYLCDLEGLARIALKQVGIVDIRGGGWCTYSDVRFESYRRDYNKPHNKKGYTGRFATIVYPTN